VRQRTGRDESHDQEEHRTSTTEQGAFSYASCSCGWLGPARRARSASRADGTAHAARQGSDDDGSSGGDGAQSANEDECEESRSAAPGDDGRRGPVNSAEIR
jgi:hypothetical protein